MASTLVLGENDAVLVDPPFTYDQIERVGDWIERSGKRLAYIYATHGHGDHWFGADGSCARFPGADRLRNREDHRDDAPAGHA